MVDARQEQRFEGIPLTMNEGVPTKVVAQPITAVKIEPSVPLDQEVGSSEPSRPLGFPTSDPPSKLVEDDLRRIRFFYGIPVSIDLRLPKKKVNLDCTRSHAFNRECEWSNTYSSYGRMSRIRTINCSSTLRNALIMSTTWSFGSTGEIGDGAKALSSQEIVGAHSSERAPTILKSKGPDRASDLVLRLEMEPLSSISFRCRSLNSSISEGNCRRAHTAGLDFIFFFSLPQISCLIFRFRGLSLQFSGFDFFECMWV
ncbi:hypothetical protein ACOSQ2_027279 [Xanthoceras sorbifolium]